MRATEIAFAKSLADRDFAAFSALVSDEAIFFGAKGPLRGKAIVLQKWEAFFKDEHAPFSWAPETVTVLDSGGLALSSGPVYDPQGHLVATFSSIWRREAPGRWRIVFDKGCDVCMECPKK